MLVQARQLVQEALRAQPGESKALCLLGCVEADLGDTATARKHFQAGLAAEPANLVLLGAWARAEALAGCLDRARELFETAYARKPDNIVLLQAWLLAVPAYCRDGCNAKLSDRHAWLHASRA